MMESKYSHQTRLKDTLYQKNRQSSISRRIPFQSGWLVRQNMLELLNQMGSIKQNKRAFLLLLRERLWIDWDSPASHSLLWVGSLFGAVAETHQTEFAFALLSAEFFPLARQVLPSPLPVLLQEFGLPMWILPFSSQLPRALWLGLELSVMIPQRTLYARCLSLIEPPLPSSRCGLTAWTKRRHKNLNVIGLGLSYFYATFTFTGSFSLRQADVGILRGTFSDSGPTNYAPQSRSLAVYWVCPLLGPCSAPCFALATIELLVGSWDSKGSTRWPGFSMVRCWAFKLLFAFSGTADWPMYTYAFGPWFYVCWGDSFFLLADPTSIPA